MDPRAGWSAAINIILAPAEDLVRSAAARAIAPGSSIRI
jgi:hypothetical protein